MDATATTATTTPTTNGPVILLDDYSSNNNMNFNNNNNNRNSNNSHECFYPPSTPAQQLPRRVNNSSWIGMLLRQYHYCHHYVTSLLEELWDSVDVLFKGRIAILLLLGPIVVVGDTFHLLEKSLCFGLSGLALIPCAERLSYLTEQIAEHTNGTISALFNATFGNAPELLISVAALRAGYYRVIQLTMLGSMITNMIFVFGVSCIIGGIRYQTQSIRTVSGNVTIGMLLMSTAGSLIPATLVLSGQFIDVPSTTTSIRSTTTSNHNNSSSSNNNSHIDEFGFTRQLLKNTIATVTPTQEEITLSRVNASVLITMYICYIIFQLGTHKDEFDDNGVVEHRTATTRPNMVCRKLCSSLATAASTNVPTVPYHDATTTIPFDIGDRLASPVTSPRGLRKKYSDRDGSILPLHHHRNGVHHNSASTSPDYHHHGYHNPYDDDSVEMEDMALLGRSSSSYPDAGVVVVDMPQQQQQPLDASSERHRRRRRHILPLIRSSSNISHNNNNNDTFDSITSNSGILHPHPQPQQQHSMKLLNLSKSFDSHEDHNITIDMSHRSIGTAIHSIQDHHHPTVAAAHCKNPVLSFRVSVVWLFIITLCVSAISDIIVDSIDEFAFQMNLSQVFTSMIIIPFFSNVAEQVSAFIFAYRNEMDLVVGVTIGSAVQIATFVLPGSVLIGYVLDRGMTLYFHSYETVCLLLCTLIVAAILQGGTTNWMVGAMLVGVYIMLAAGIWFHEIENLSVDTEELIDALH